jgi:WhiB family redox-sensing transcriptional regulator
MHMAAIHSLSNVSAPADTEAVESDWMNQANCQGHTPLFFPPRAERPQARARREARARKLCMQCAVLDQCRAFARDHHEYGFWAGESEEDRHVAGFTVSAPIGVRARTSA